MARLQKKLSAADKVKKKDQPTDSTSGAGDGTGSDEAAKSVAPGLKQEAKTVEKRIRPVAPVSVEPGEPNRFQKAIQFFREVKVELKKVTWPNRKQTAGSTLVVIILVFILATFLGLVDFGLSKLVQVVLA
ncbi:MAG: preprotein translocase subunit SecE [Pseudomonadota bacterium]